MNQEIVDSITKKFEELYGDTTGAKIYFAPGRVNLIGEHVDYLGGHVFPCALTIGTYMIVKPRTDSAIRFFSINIKPERKYEDKLENIFSHENPDKQYVKALGWTAYPKGVIWAFNKARKLRATHGFDAVVGGDIPAGSGLSSSASLEVLMGYVLRDMFNWTTITNIDLAKIGKYSENNFNGVNCGIMDQFASAMGKKDCAIFLDTSSLEFVYAPIKLNGAKIVVTNTNKPHSLADSKYNERRAQAEEAFKDLKTVKPELENLCDLQLEDFYQLGTAIKNPTCWRRAKHAISENERTLKAVEVLKQGKIDNFGDLMNEAGASIRYDYEATCHEQDVLVDASRVQNGVIGVRMTGGGWGGCIVALVKDEFIDSYKQNVAKIYSERTQYKPSFYVVSVGDGPSVVKVL